MCASTLDKMENIIRLTDNIILPWCKPDNIILPWCVAQSANWTSHMGSRKTERLLFITQAGTGFSNWVGTGKRWGKDNSIWVNVAQDCVLYFFSQNYFYSSRRAKVESLEKKRGATLSFRKWLSRLSQGTSGSWDTASHREKQ